MKSVLERLRDKDSHKNQGPSISDQNTTENRCHRSQGAHHPPNVEMTATSLRDRKCIICDSKSHKQEYLKYRICESSRASLFLAAATFFQDDVFTRTCDLQDAYAVFGADLFYHMECMPKYLYKYDSRDKAFYSKASERRLAWDQVVNKLENGLKNGKGYELSVIRDRLNTMNKDCNFRNRDVKIFLINHFGNEIKFTYPSVVNKSVMVYSVPSNVLADHIRSVDPVQAYASLETTTSSLKDMLWSLLRIYLKNDQLSIYHQTQKVPSWCASNSVWTNEAITEKQLAFLPVLPYPVMQYSTVYTAMRNVMDICSHLTQKEIPVYSDEGVYCIVREIQLMRPEKFRSLVPCLGTFHLTKTVLKCIGKYLEGSGAELTWLEAGIFGPTVIEKSVLNGGHYSRCLEGMQLLSESLWRLLYQEFFREKGIQPYSFEFVTLNNLRAAVQCRDIAESQRYLAEFGVASKIMEHLKLFKS